MSCLQAMERVDETAHEQASEDESLAYLNLAPLGTEELVDKTAQKVTINLRRFNSLEKSPTRRSTSHGCAVINGSPSGGTNCARPCDWIDIELQQQQHLFLTGARDQDKEQAIPRSALHDHVEEGVGFDQGPRKGSARETELERTTGGLVWDAGVVLAEYSIWNRERLFPSIVGKGCESTYNTLELGSGCGLVGIAMGRLGQRVLLTDLPEPAGLLENLQANIALNNVEKNCTAVALEWGEEPFLDTIEVLLGRYGRKAKHSGTNGSRALIAFDTSLNRSSAYDKLYANLDRRKETLFWEERVKHGKDLSDPLGSRSAKFDSRKDDVVIIEISLVAQ